jgi:hypothetical protein
MVKAIVYIDEFGAVCEEAKSKYTVRLNGQYTWSPSLGKWKYGVSSTTPAINLLFLYSDKELLKKMKKA